MKILELNFERTWRGGERQTIYNIQGFLEKNHEVTLVCRKNFPLEKHAADKGYNIVSFDNILQVVFFLIMQGKKFDVLHAQTSHILTYCLLTKPFHRRKVIFSRRVDFVPKGFLTRLKYRYTDKIVAISNAVKNIVENFSGRDDVVVASDIVMPLTLDKGKAQRFLRSKNISGSQWIIGTVAALVPHKDPLTMVETIKELAIRRNDFIFLHFGTGELQDELDRKIKEYALENIYYRMGFVEEVEHFFSILDVFVISSQEEGLGSSVLDAFLYKVPVAGTDAGGLKDLLDDGRAVQCSKRSPVLLANGIERILLQTTEEKNKMVQKAYEYVMHKHNLGYITERYLSVIR